MQGPKCSRRISPNISYTGADQRKQIDPGDENLGHFKTKSTRSAFALSLSLFTLSGLGVGVLQRPQILLSEPMSRSTFRFLLRFSTAARRPFLVISNRSLVELARSINFDKFAWASAIGSVVTYRVIA